MRAFLVILLLLAACGPAPAAAPSAPAATAPAAPPRVPAAEAPARPAPTREPATVEAGVISFTLSYWPLWVGEARGFFADEGIRNEVTATRSMTSGLSALTGGSLHLLGGSLTAFIQAVERGADLVSVAASQYDPAYSLVARPEIGSTEQLRGRTLAVSALNGGDTVVLRKLLAARGIAESEVELTLAGGTPERYAAMASGGAVAAVLGQPQDLQAQAQGYRRLAISTEVLQEYQFNTWVTGRDWARRNADTLVSWVRAYGRASQWLVDPANREEAIAVGSERTRAEPDVVRQTYDLYFQQLAGRVFAADPVVSLAGLRVTIDDMVASGELPAPTSPEKYVDNSYLERAKQVGRP